MTGNPYDAPAVDHVESAPVLWRYKKRLAAGGLILGIAIPIADIIRHLIWIRLAARPSGSVSGTPILYTIIWGAIGCTVLGALFGLIGAVAGAAIDNVWSREPSDSTPNSTTTDEGA